jgi:Mg-chelatase subunit ChlD
MPPTWIRRSFTAPGLTQIPPGPNLRAVQERFGGTVMLCIDVSGSMSGSPLIEAVQGARQFVTEAVAAHYKIGVILWDDGRARRGADSRRHESAPRTDSLPRCS